ncbi:MAG: nucleotide exchange factor GrpE [Acutalibacteraceae bacterium]
MSKKENDSTAKEEKQETENTVENSSENTAEKSTKKTAEKATKKTSKAEKEKEVKKSDLDKVKEELNNQKESYLRLAAEYENYRKRTQQEKLGIYDDATAKAVTEILPIADSLVLAQQNAEGAPEEFTKGLELINSQFASAMEKLNIISFGEVGEEFDPLLHNAVSKVERDDLGENQISMVFQKGFKIGDKIIRHAMVQVANCD